MRPQIDEWTIVLPGAWNSRVFSPQWVAQHLLHKEKLEIELGVSTTGPHIRYRTNNIVLIPKDDRLIIGALNGEDGTLEQMERVACMTLELLPHTPIVAAGVNFGFLEASPEPDLLTLFETADLRALTKFGCEVPLTELRRELKTDAGVVNLKHVFRDGTVKIHVNFHYDTESSEGDRERLAGKVTDARDFAHRLLNEVYSLSIEEEEYSDDVGE